jgi:hypothetical protein
MDGARFDGLTRALAEARSRRHILSAGLAGVLGALGHATTQAKKKPCPPCKKRKKGKCKGTLSDGTGCSGGTCQGGSCVAAVVPPQPCVPESQAATCNGRCGTWLNTCGHYVTCPTCTDGKVCLGSGSCAIPCTAEEPCGVGGSCYCQVDITGAGYCRAFLGACPNAPCTTSADCPLGTYCKPTACDDGLPRQCWPLCAT